eukprot:328251-Pelagomonas_calceolata.AAC.11
MWTRRERLHRTGNLRIAETHLHTSALTKEGACAAFTRVSDFNQAYSLCLLVASIKNSEGELKHCPNLRGNAVACSYWEGCRFLSILAVGFCACEGAGGAHNLTNVYPYEHERQRVPQKGKVGEHRASF